MLRAIRWSPHLWAAGGASNAQGTDISGAGAGTAAPTTLANAHVVIPSGGITPATVGSHGGAQYAHAFYQLWDFNVTHLAGGAVAVPLTFWGWDPEQANGAGGWVQMQMESDINAFTNPLVNTGIQSLLLQAIMAGYTAFYVQIGACTNVATVSAGVRFSIQQ